MRRGRSRGKCLLSSILVLYLAVAYALFGVPVACSPDSALDIYVSDESILSEEIEILPGGPVLYDIRDDGVPLGDDPDGESVLPSDDDDVEPALLVNRYAEIDYGHANDGYVSARWFGTDDARVVFKIVGPQEVPGEDADTGSIQDLVASKHLSGRVYDVPLDGTPVTAPLTDGPGTYLIGIYRNKSGNVYSRVMAMELDIGELFGDSVFLAPNGYVAYSDDGPVAEKARDLCDGLDSDVHKIEAVYQYVRSHVGYDGGKAKSVRSGYLSDPEATLETGKGICIDFAVLSAAMLRLEGVPCKVIVGYAGDTYHAWIEAWDGESWVMRDPTFAASLSDWSLRRYIGDGSSYVKCWEY